MFSQFVYFLHYGYEGETLSLRELEEDLGIESGSLNIGISGNFPMGGPPNPVWSDPDMGRLQQYAQAIPSQKRKLFWAKLLRQYSDYLGRNSEAGNFTPGDLLPGDDELQPQLQPIEDTDWFSAFEDDYLPYAEPDPTEDLKPRPQLDLQPPRPQLDLQPRPQLDLQPRPTLDLAPPRPQLDLQPRPDSAFDSDIGWDDVFSDDYEFKILEDQQAAWDDLADYRSDVGNRLDAYLEQLQNNQPPKLHPDLDVLPTRPDSSLLDLHPRPDASGSGGGFRPNLPTDLDLLPPRAPLDLPTRSPLSGGGGGFIQELIEEIALPLAAALTYLNHPYNEKNFFETLWSGPTPMTYEEAATFLDRGVGPLASFTDTWATYWNLIKTGEIDNPRYDPLTSPLRNAPGFFPYPVLDPDPGGYSVEELRELFNLPPGELPDGLVDWLAPDPSPLNPDGNPDPAGPIDQPLPEFEWTPPRYADQPGTGPTIPPISPSMQGEIVIKTWKYSWDHNIAGYGSRHAYYPARIQEFRFPKAAGVAFEPETVWFELGDPPERYTPEYDDWVDRVFFLRFHPSWENLPKSWGPLAIQSPWLGWRGMLPHFQEIISIEFDPKDDDDDDDDGLGSPGPASDYGPQLDQPDLPDLDPPPAPDLYPPDLPDLDPPPAQDLYPPDFPDLDWPDFPDLDPPDLPDLDPPFDIAPEIINMPYSSGPKLEPDIEPQLDQQFEEEDDPIPTIDPDNQDAPAEYDPTDPLWDGLPLLFRPDPDNPLPPNQPCKTNQCAQSMQHAQQNNARELIAQAASIADLATNLTLTQGKLDDLLTRVGPQIDGGISGYITKFRQAFDKAWEATRMDKVVNLVTMLASVHNAAMLSRNLGQTLGELASQVLGVFGIKDENGTLIDVNEIIGSTIENAVKTVVGEDIYNGVSTTWNKASRILSAASSIVWTVRSMHNAAYEIAEWSAENLGRIGNALKRWGVVGERAYPWMAEKINAQEKWRNRMRKFHEGVESLDEAASSLYTVTGNVLEIQQESSEIAEQITNFNTAVQEAFPEDGIENVPIANDRETELEVSEVSDIQERELGKGD